MSFVHAGLLWWLIPLSVWGLWSIRHAPRLIAPAVRLRHPGILGTAERVPSTNRLVPLLRVAGLGLLLLALARPQQPGEWIVPPPSGRDIALVVDASGSMRLSDFSLETRSVSRLEMVKHVLANFIEKRSADRFSLTVFGSSAAALTLPTFDRAHVVRQIERLQPGVLEDWSAVGDALGLAVRSVRQDTLRPALILIGDGELANAGTLHPGEAVAVAIEAGVRIHALQIGPGPAVSPSDLTPDPAQDLQPSFADIARLTGGQFAVVRDAADAHAFLSLVDTIEPTLQPNPDVREMLEWYPLPTVLALLLLAFARLREARAGADA